MKYEEMNWGQRGAAVVYVKNPDERQAFIEAFEKTHSGWRTRILDCILHYKKGFLQKDRIITKFLVEKTPKAQRSEVEQKIEQCIERLDLTEYRHRKPNAMGASAMYMWSLLADALWGQNRFLVWDDGTTSRGRAVRMVKWLKEYKPESTVVWLTCCPDEEVLADAEALDLPCRYWKARQGSLIELDYDELLAKKRAAEAEQRARWEAEMTEKKARADALLQEKQDQEALAIYQVIASEGWGPAMVPAARLLYKYGTEEQKEEAQRLCRRAGTAEGWIQLGDWKMEAFQKLEKSSKDAGREKLGTGEKHIAIDRLYDAVTYYQRAAEKDDPEACYKLVELHLRYTFSRESSASWDSFSYTSDNALPYIKQLIAMKEAGMEGVHLYLIDIQIRYGKQYERALKEYREENQ